MIEGYQALTTKERETLSLLLRGYDAKSMARHLGLSVHTINERLREARRKMAVSSSREAARRMQEIEAGAPKLLGDSILGDAPGPEDMAYPVQPAAVHHPMHAKGWLIGALLMSVIFAALMLSPLTGAGDAPPAAPTTIASSPAVESDTAGAARQWLSLVDQGDWAGSWQATGDAFRTLNTVGVWAKASERVRTPLGAMITRRLVSEEYVPAPPQGYQIVKFRTDYANKAGALETVSLSQQGGSWKVVGITVE